MISNKILIRRLATHQILYKEIPNNIKGKNKVAQEWITRQITDPYVKRAKIHNLRCRSAFKLIQINDKYRILKPGNIVIDCGAAPGSWSQVAATQTNSNKKEPELASGKVIGIDLMNIFPVEGVTFLTQCDITSAETQNKIVQLLDGEKADVVLSDIAPNATGVKQMDHDILMDIAYHILRFSVLNLNIKGTCLVKLWAGNQTKKFEDYMKKFYGDVKYVKPHSSRGDSAEIYILGRYFKGIKTDKTSS